MTDELKPCLAYPCAGYMKENNYDASLECSSCQFIVADELEYSAIVAGRQAAIDAALESLKTSCRKCEYDEYDGSLIDHCPDCQRKIVTALYAIKGTNPLAEAQARIAELEDAITRMNSATIIRQRDDLLVQIEELAHQLAESECRNVSLASWQCPYTDGKSGLTSDEYGNQYCAKDRQLAETRKDAERYRWLCADLVGEERIKRNGILCRMPVMSYSAASADIDAAMRQEEE